MPDDDDDPGDIDLGHGVENVEDHGAPTQLVEGLGTFRMHPGSLTCGEHHSGQLAFVHRSFLAPPAGPEGIIWPGTVCGVEPYDEFGLFSENAAEYGIAYPGPPAVRRVEVEVAPGRRVSSLLWGTTPPELVLVHGGAQNAHTWDTVALALDRPLLAIDLPGHGHSDGGPDGSLSIDSNGADLAKVIAQLAPDAAGVVGMSLGGLSSIALAQHAPRTCPCPCPGRHHSRRQRREVRTDHLLHRRAGQFRQL